LKMCVDPTRKDSVPVVERGKKGGWGRAREEEDRFPSEYQEGGGDGLFDSRKTGKKGSLLVAEEVLLKRNNT